VSQGSRVHIFDYLDYRAYLRDFYRDQKAQARPFSFRAFARRAGIRSYNYLQLVMKGERDLSPTMATQFARGCGLEANESAYFCELVSFGQAKTTEERNRAYERLSQFRPFRAAHRLEPAQAAYHECWYIPAIRELVTHPDFSDDPRWIASVLRPNISVSQAKNALQTLSDLGLIIRDNSGQFKQTDAVVTTGSGPLGHHIVNYHRTMMVQAAKSLDEVPRDERDISSITLSIREDAIATLKQRIDAFRKELLELAEAYGPVDRVVQLNIQLFPLTTKKVRSL
jgi:uncharacterized protein (TIGR02147 family)